jgi:hypothetical protein
MLMVMVYITLYIFAVRNDFKHPWLIALGFIFFLAFKTKESTLVLSVLLIGLGFSDGNRFRFQTLWKNLIFFFIGLLGGILFFIILNTIFLRDPLFGFSPTTIKAFLDSYATVPLGKIEPKSPGWYSGGLTTIWLLPFLLYLISGIKTEGRLSTPTRLIWLVPISLVIFLTIMTFWRSYKVDLRFFFPALPVLCFLAPQFLDFKIPASRATHFRFWLYLTLTVFVCLGINYAIRPLSNHMNLNFDSFLDIIVYPLLISILILLAFFVKKYSYKTVLIPVACILSMTIYPIRTNIKYLAILHQNEAFVNHRFYPFSTFAKQISFTQDMQVYVSSNLHEQLDMLSTDKNEVVAMFNVYFDSHARNTNFKVSSTSGVIPQNLRQGSYKYILLTLQDWQALTDNSSNLSWLKANYNYFEDPENLVILLVHK